MFRTLLLAVIAVAITAPTLVAAGTAAPGLAQQTRSAQRQLTSRVLVMVPAEDAELVVNGQAIAGRGRSREFDFPAPPNRRYTVTVTWKPNHYTAITRTKTVTLRAGQPAKIDLTVDDPADRVRVMYISTPQDVVDAMVDLAGIKPTDVVYEPGCGDARITITAIRKGARRGLCIDIDPERARESRMNVKDAGFADRIDVREGDALDVKALADVSVVFLYMGDYFNLLIRPVLWRELKVGSRIVSNLFTMGDWKPDKTITATNRADGHGYPLYVWTITEEIKRRQTAR